MTNAELIMECEDLLEIAHEREYAVIRAIQDALAFLDAGAGDRAKQILRQLIDEYQLRKQYD
jgi:predicted negative regulator of RcsB-dependent stress response